MIYALILATCAAALVARTALLVVTVRGGSMVPAYQDGDRVLALRWLAPRRGRVVVFRPPATWMVGPNPPYFVKRVVAVAGDTLGAEVVPRGRLVVYGDSPISTDSRTFGYLPAKAVRAVVVVSLARTRAPHR
ncbi:signal peptidase I [Streptosporangiaceae bacterium NEAU-GS5]|nr:signal peptidase I [Streptosporangiaceae bacterium NEAU-GS5]